MYLADAGCGENWMAVRLHAYLPAIPVWNDNFNGSKRNAKAG
jgi:hypothetical protein